MKILRQSIVASVIFSLGCAVCLAEDHDHSLSGYNNISFSLNNFGTQTAMQTYNSMNAFKSSPVNTCNYSLPATIQAPPQQYSSRLSNFISQQQTKLNSINQDLSQQYSGKLNEIESRKFQKDHFAPGGGIKLDLPELKNNNQSNYLQDNQK